MMVSLVVYLPESALEKVKAAMFAAGAGKMGNYDHCCWQTQGVGQFRPLEGSNPAIGAQGTIEQVKEWKVEMVCEKALVNQVIQAMKAAHPYETPAFLVMDTVHF